MMLEGRWIVVYLVGLISYSSFYDILGGGLRGGELLMLGIDDMDAHALDEYLQEQAADMERLEYLNDMYQGQYPQQSDTSSGGGAGAGASFSDEEYDDLFMDLAEHQPHMSASGQGFGHSQDMDMS